MQYNSTPGPMNTFVPFPLRPGGPESNGHLQLHGNQGRHHADHAKPHRHRHLDTQRPGDFPARLTRHPAPPQRSNNRFPSIGRPAPGVTISNGGIQIVGNDGTPNAISVGLSAMQWTQRQRVATTSTVSLPFTPTQSANGQGTTASMVAYDSLGTPLTVNITAVLVSRTSSSTTYRWYADCGQNNTGSRERTSPSARARSASTARATSSRHPIRPFPSSKPTIPRSHCNSISIFPRSPALPQAPRR